MNVLAGTKSGSWHAKHTTPTPRNQSRNPVMENGYGQKYLKLLEAVLKNLSQILASVHKNTRIVSQELVQVLAVLYHHQVL